MVYWLFERTAEGDMSYEEFIQLEIKMYIENTQAEHTSSKSIYGPRTRNKFSNEQKQFLLFYTEFYAPLKRGTQNRLSEQQKLLIKEIQVWLIHHPFPGNTLITNKVIRGWYRNLRTALLRKQQRK